MGHSESDQGSEAVFQTSGSLVLFGHEPDPVTVSLLEYARGRRIRRAALLMLAGLVVAPLVVLVPPHVPWLLGALGGSGFLAWRTLKGRYAVVSVRGHCPRCGAPIEVRPGTRLRTPHPLTCASCQHDLMLEVDPEKP